MATTRLLSRQLHSRLANLFCNAQSDVLISTPYISNDGAQVALTNLHRDFQQKGCVNLLTDLSPRNIYQSSTDPSAILAMCDHVQQMKVSHIPSLHAKVYVADCKVAIITSANLTAGGLYRNYEYGVEFTEPNIVSNIRTDIHEYSLLGATVEHDRLSALCTAAQELRRLFDRKMNTVSKKLSREFDRKVQNTEDDLIRMRLAGGPMHTVFEKTVIYLLKRYGPMTTKQLHPHISSIHPDLCDDSVDRVIDGQHFGKKWKHAVRTAQQQLKRKQSVEFDGKLWKAS